MKYIVLLLLPACALGAVPSVKLSNAALSDVYMPAMGLGTGGYTGTKVPYGAYPECWWTTTGCGDYALQATKEYLALGGTRIDNANSYQNQATIGQAVAQSGVDRKNVFFVSKIGPTQPLGYNDTLKQWTVILNETQLGYIDLLLVHWPVTSSYEPTAKSIDPVCNHDDPTYDERVCRLHTWKAMVEIFQTGKVRAIGVSNYNITHLEEIEQAGYPLPAVNQCPYNIYLSTQQDRLRYYCQAKNIVFNGYSPLGIPDWKTFPAPLSPNLLNDPVLVEVAKKYNKTPAQVSINWQWQLGIVVNPRSMNRTHMIENLNAYDFTLSNQDVMLLSSRPQDMCTMDPDYYECAPRP